MTAKNPGNPSLTCRRCGKSLSSAEAIRLGYGSKCWRKIWKVVKGLEEDPACQVNTEPVSISDPARALEVRDEIQRRIDASEETCICGKPARAGILGSYDHEGGYMLPGFKERQWIFTTCERCGWQFSIHKMVSVDISDIERQAAQEARQEKEPDVNALIEELKEFDYSAPQESAKKVKASMQAKGYSTEGLEEALGQGNPLPPKYATYEYNEADQEPARQFNEVIYHPHEIEDPAGLEDPEDQEDPGKIWTFKNAKGEYEEDQAASEAIEALRNAAAAENAQESGKIEKWIIEMADRQDPDPTEATPTPAPDRVEVLKTDKAKRQARRQGKPKA